MAIPRKPNADGSLTVHRLDLDPELAAVLSAQANANERTLPGQIRIALRQWMEGQAAAS
jgi:hypothetical protein